MNGQALVTGLLAIVGGVLGLAIISVLVSPKAQTSSVLTASGGALSTVIGAAVSPVTGQSTGASASSMFGSGVDLSNLF